MRQRLFTFLGIFLLVFLLIGLNAASYAPKDTIPDRESEPNRSTFNTGATGTRAFYELLAETGRNPVRWQENFDTLDRNSKDKPQTFVVIGSLQKDFTKDETKKLLRWVSAGGRLVVIDRLPLSGLISTTAKWKISSTELNYPPYDTDPSNQQEMTGGMPAVRPAQPTIFTTNVNAVQPSLYAASIRLEKLAPGETPTPTPDVVGEEYPEDEPPPPPKPAPTADRTIQSGKKQVSVIQSAPADGNKDAPDEAAPFRAPVVHLLGSGRNMLVDFPYNSGRIVFLTDPYIVSNAGIGLVDNAQLAINIAASNGGPIAFDEYHHGYGANQNNLSAYFAGTPIPAIFIQALLFIGLLFFTQSRRFARALPADEPNRLSKLEYVSAMAELQQRTKAYDLAIENIYADFRRRAARFFGVDNYTIKQNELAKLIADRLKMNAGEIEKLLRKAEDISHGEPTGKREVLEITTRLRELEEKLNLKRTRRQTFAR